MVDVAPQLLTRLYAVAPDEFVHARDDAAARARADGDPDLAKAISKLRKPTNSAWVVNQLAIRRPELIAEMFELADAMRSAQQAMRGDRLRALSARRRELIGRLVDQALGQRGRRGAPVKATPAEIEATLMAALTDPQLADQLRAGRMMRTVSYREIAAVPTVSDDTAATGPSQPGRDRAADRRARELAAAQAAEADAKRRLDQARSAENDAAAAVRAIDDELDELQRRRRAAEKALRDQSQAHQRAGIALKAAQDRLREAQSQTRHTR